MLIQLAAESPGAVLDLSTHVTPGEHSLTAINEISLDPADATLLSFWVAKPQVMARLDELRLDNNRAICGTSFGRSGHVQALETDTSGFVSLLTQMPPCKLRHLSFKNCCLGKEAMDVIQSYLDREIVIGPPNSDAARKKGAFHNNEEKRRLLACHDEEMQLYKKCYRSLERREQGYRQRLVAEASDPTVMVRCQLKKLDLANNEGLVGQLDGNDELTRADSNHPAFRIFCKRLNASLLVDLDLSFCGLGPTSLMHLAEYAQNPQANLQRLTIAGNPLSGAVDGQAKRTRGGIHVRTYDMDIDTEMVGIEAFFAKEKPLYLSHLDVRTCGLGPRSANICAVALDAHTKIPAYKPKDQLVSGHTSNPVPLRQ